MKRSTFPFILILAFIPSLLGIEDHHTLSCLYDPPQCDDDGIQHLPLRKTLEWAFNGSWNLTLNSKETGFQPIKISPFSGKVKITRISHCRMAVRTSNVVLEGTDEVLSGKHIIVISRRRLLHLCNAGDPSQTDNRIGHLSSSIISALLKKKQLAHVAKEFDGFGDCDTTYSIEKETKKNKIFRKIKDLKSCGKQWYEFGGEKRENLENVVSHAKWECIQQFEGNLPKAVNCTHQIGLHESQNFESKFQLRFLSSGSPDTLIFKNLKEIPLTMLERSPGNLKPMAVLEKLCSGLQNSLSSDLMENFPDILSNLRLFNTKDIIELFKNLKEMKCPEEELLTSLLMSVMENLNTAASAAAKCHLMHRKSVPLNKKWIFSLLETEFPEEDTLRECYPLLITDLDETFLSVASLAGKVADRSVTKKGESIFSDDYMAIARSLWRKAVSCHNPRKHYQTMALWAIKGLSKLHPSTKDITQTLKTCAGSSASTREIAVASLQALKHDKCIAGTPQWLYSFIMDSNYSSELRIEAFKSLLVCDFDMAQSLLNSVSTKGIDFQSSQVTSYLNSISGNRTSLNSLFSLSRHFDLNFTEFGGLPNGSHLEGDIIFEDSFLPRSFRIHAESSLLKIFGRSVQIGIRQENLEDILQPLFGPSGIFKNTHEFFQTIFSKVMDYMSHFISKDSEKHRSKRDVTVQDIRKIVDQVKSKIKGDLKFWVNTALGEKESVIHVSLSSLFSNIDAMVETWIEETTRKVYSSIMNGRIEEAFVFNIQDKHAKLWSFFGPQLSIHHHEGIIASFRGSSHINFMSMLSSPLNPWIDMHINPRIGAYSLSSLAFHTDNHLFKAEVKAPLTSGFDAALRIKPQDHQQIEMELELHEAATHGYEVHIEKNLLVCKDSSQGQSSSRECHEITTIPRINEGQMSVCNEEIFAAIGMNACIQQTSMTSGSIEKSNTKFTVKRGLRDIEFHKIILSSKNPGLDSYFMSAVIETVGPQRKLISNAIIGVTFAPHATLKLLFQGGGQSASFEASVVNDPNMKRLEGRATYGREEYGLKAELLLVSDGGQVTVKPRLVVTRPLTLEDALLQGYMSLYSSDKVKSFTLDLTTDGSFKKIFDVSMKGTTECKTLKSGEWSMNLRNFHMKSPELELGVEASLASNSGKKDLDVQLTIDDEVLMFGGSFLSSNSTEAEDFYEIGVHVLSPNHPKWDTIVDIHTTIGNNEIRNNITLQNGPEGNKWDFDLSHSTNWHFEYNKLYSDSEGPSMWNALLRPGRSSNLNNNLRISIPSEDFIWNMMHTFQSSEKSIENKVLLKHNGDDYSIMTNFYDQSEKLFKYHMEIETDVPTWKFSYVDTILQRAEGDVIGQSLTKMPSGRIYTSSSRIKYDNTVERFNLELSLDTIIKDGGESRRISTRHTLEHTMSNLNFLITVDTPDPILNLELSIDGLDSSTQDLYMKALVKDIIQGEITLGNSEYHLDLESTMAVILLNKSFSSKMAIAKFGSYGDASFEGQIAFSSINNPVVNTVALKVSSSIEYIKAGNYLLKGDIDFLGSKWTSVMESQLSNNPNEEKSLAFYLQFPDGSKFEAITRMHIDVGKPSLDVLFFVRLPSNVVYKFSMDGKSNFKKRRMAEAELNICLDSPLTEEIVFNSSVKNMLYKGIRSFLLKVNTHSEADLWKPLLIDINMERSSESIDLNFESLINEQKLNIDLSGSYKWVNETTDFKIATEVKLPGGDVIQQLKIAADGIVRRNSSSREVTISHKCLFEKNFGQILKSNGEINIHVPKASGNLIIIHNGTKLSKHEFKLEGTYTGSELNVSVNGMSSNTPVRIEIYYIDGESFYGFASYGGASYASVEFKTKLKRFSLRLREKEDRPTKLTTGGIIMFKGHRSRFFHVLKVSDQKTSAILRIQNVLGNPLRITATRLKKSQNRRKSTARVTWGHHKISYKDNLRFSTIRNFDVDASFSAPTVGLRDHHMKIVSSHKSRKDQQVHFLYEKEKVALHRGTISIETSLLLTANPWLIDAKFTDLLLDRKHYKDIHLYQTVKSSPNSGLTVKTQLDSDRIRLSEFEIESKENSRQIAFVICSGERDCLQLKALAHALNLYATTSNFTFEINSINSLYSNNNNKRLILNSVALTTENELPGGGDLKISAKVTRSSCHNISCVDKQLMRIQHIAFNIKKNAIDVHYETTNRTIAFRTELLKGIRSVNKTGYTSSVIPSKTLKMTLWFDKLNLPNDAVVLKSTYNRFKDAESRSVDGVEVVLNHPKMKRPLKIDAKLSSSPNNVRQDLSIDLQIFENPKDDLQIVAVKDFDNGQYNLKADLLSRTTEQLRMSLSALTIPSPDDAVIVLRMVIPKNGAVTSKENEIILKCSTQVHENTDVACKLTSPTYDESWYLGFEGANQCHGMNAYTHIFGKDYKAFGQRCWELPSFQYGLSLSESTKEDFIIEAGLIDSKSLHLRVFDMLNGIIKLHEPLILQFSFNNGSDLTNTWNRFKNAVVKESKFFVSNVKTSCMKLYTNTKVLFSRLDRITESSLVEDFVMNLSETWEVIHEELQRDDLYKDLYSLAEKSVYLANEGIEYVISCMNTLEEKIAIDVSINNLMLIPKIWTERILNVFWQEATNFIHSLNSLVDFAAHCTYKIWNYMMAYTSFDDIIHWLRTKVQTVSGWNTEKLLEKFIGFITEKFIWVFSLFYPDIENDADQAEYSFLLPLPESAFSIIEVLELLKSGKRRERFKKTLEEELEDIGELIMEPEELIDTILPPYKAQGSILPNGIVTFDGKAVTLDPYCNQVLFVASIKDSFQIVLVAEKFIDGSKSDRRGLVLLVGDNVIQITPTLEVLYNDLSVWMPLRQAALRIIRDLTYIRIYVHGLQDKDIFELSCSVNVASCVVEVDGWLRKDTKGLMGNFDGNMYNDFTKPNGKATVNEEAWKSSWTINTECATGISNPGMLPNSRPMSLCSRMLYGYTSPVLPCHNIININPYFDLCRKSSITAFQNTTRSDRRLITVYDKAIRRGGTSSRLFPDFANGYSPHKLVPEASNREMRVLCNVLESYSSVCRKRGVELVAPLSCDKNYNRRDPQNDNSILVDVLMLIEQDTCSDFLHEHLVTLLPETMKGILPRTNISSSFGVIGYATTPTKGHSLSYYGKGKSLLSPFEDFIYPELPVEFENERGSLIDALEVVKKFPFRKGSVRVVLVLACSSQDIPFLDKSLLKDAQERRILYYSLIPEKLFRESNRPKANKNIIGFDSKYIYHLRKEKIKLGNNWKVEKPSSNIAQLSLRSGGGLFTILEIKDDRKASLLMRSFREVLTKTMFFFSREEHNWRRKDNRL